MMRAEMIREPVTTFKLDSKDELSAIIDLAQAIAGRFKLDAQTLKSSILASEVQGTQIIADHIALTHGSDTQIKTPEIVQTSFDTPILWGSVATKVDQVLTVLVPSHYSDTDYTALKDQLIAEFE